jgi:predicted RNase H-like HicB family nuclease
MHKVRFVYWQEGDLWLGYLQDYPDYWTQGKTLKDLKEHLNDLYRDLTSGDLRAIGRSR